MINKKTVCAVLCALLTVSAVGCKDKNTVNHASDSGTPVNSSVENVPVIDLDEAKSIALRHAGLSENNNVVFTKTKLDRDDGKEEYNIEFTAGGIEYEYEIDAVSGSVLEFSSEIISDKPADKSYSSAEISGQITVDEAKAIALKHAGINESAAVFTKTESYYDDGIVKYDIEFTAGIMEYEYEIRASNGAVLENSAEAKEQTMVVAWGNTTLDEAKAIALKHAGFTAEQVVFTKSELDHDDGMTVYEIEFNANGIKYKYKICDVDN